MMAESKLRSIRDGSDREYESISEGDETKCSDDIWIYYEAHKDEAEDLDDYLKRRGLKI